MGNPNPDYTEARIDALERRDPAQYARAVLDGGTEPEDELLFAQYEADRVFTSRSTNTQRQRHTIYRANHIDESWNNLLGLRD